MTTKEAEVYVIYPRFSEAKPNNPEGYYMYHGFWGVTLSSANHRPRKAWLSSLAQLGMDTSKNEVIRYGTVRYRHQWNATLLQYYLNGIHPYAQHSLLTPLDSETACHYISCNTIDCYPRHTLWCALGAGTSRGTLCWRGTLLAL